MRLSLVVGTKYWCCSRTFIVYVRIWVGWGDLGGLDLWESLELFSGTSSGVVLGPWFYSFFFLSLVVCFGYSGVPSYGVVLASFLEVVDTLEIDALTSLLLYMGTYIAERWHRPYCVVCVGALGPHFLRSYTHTHMLPEGLRYSGKTLCAWCLHYIEYTNRDDTTRKDAETMVESMSHKRMSMSSRTREWKTEKG